MTAEEETLSVAEAKARFSELIDRVAHGDRFVVSRRGRPVLGLVPADEASARPRRPRGLLTVVGALAEWETLDEDVADIVSARTRARDRRVPDVG